MNLSRPATTLLAIGCGLAISACGSSGGSGRATGSSPSSPARGIAFADCMRAHGVPNFPDPTGGAGIQLSAASGINPASPSFRRAQTQCATLLPGAGPPSGHASAQIKAEMLATSTCMRAHGVSGFPDPTVSRPPDPGSFSIALGRDGVFLAVPLSIDVNSPAFQRAASACRFGGGRGGAHSARGPA